MEFRSLSYIQIFRGFCTDYYYYYHLRPPELLSVLLRGHHREPKIDFFQNSVVGGTLNSTFDHLYPATAFHRGSIFLVCTIQIGFNLYVLKDFDFFFMQLFLLLLFCVILIQSLSSIRITDVNPQENHSLGFFSLKFPTDIKWNYYINTTAKPASKKVCSLCNA